MQVSLHRSRLTRRCFNQAVLMARGVARRIGPPVSDKLKAVRTTRDQVELSGDARRTNVAGAYAPHGPVAGCVLCGDDIFTTGTSLSECAFALREGGRREGACPNPVQDLLTKEARCG